MNTPALFDKTARKSWSRGDLLIAMHLYCQMPFGQFHARNPTLIAIAKHMGRTPGSLAMKLCNLASLDPVHQHRGVVGLKGASQADRGIWQEFSDDWNILTDESAAAFEALTGNASNPNPIQEHADEANIALRTDTEGVVTVKARRGQGFFRAAI